MASWRLGAGPRCPGDWCLTGLLLAHVCFNLGVLFPAGDLVGSVCVRSCSHAFILTKKRAGCFPSLSLVQQQLWQQGGRRLERGGAVGQARAELRGQRESSGPEAEARWEPRKGRMQGQVHEHTQGNRTGTEPRQ